MIEIKKIANNKQNIIRECLIAILPICLFCIGGVLSSFRNGNQIRVHYWIMIAGIIVITLLLIGLNIYNASLKFKREEVIYVILLILLSLLIRIPQIETIPRNDSSVYYYALQSACSNFRFSYNYIIKNFNLASHPSYGYSILCAIFELFNPNDFKNIWFSHTFMAIAGILMMFDIFYEICNGKAKKAMMGAFVFGCNPMFLGLNTYMQLDFGTAVFFFYVVWAFFRKRYILLIFSSILLVLSKEFGVCLLVGLFIGIFLYEFIDSQEKDLKIKIKKIFNPATLCLFLLCAILGVCILYYIFGSGLAWINVAETVANNNTSQVGYVGLDFNYCLYKIKQILIFNFDWLQIIIIVICVSAKIFDKNNLFKNKKTRLIVSGVISAQILYFIFSCLMVTYTIPRYNLVISMAITFIMIVVALQFNYNNILYKVECLFVSILLMIQAYVTIDPLMWLTYPHLEFSYAPLIYSNKSNSNYVGDYAIYNYQYTYIDTAIRNGLRLIQFDDNTDLTLLFGDDWVLLGGANGNIFWDNYDGNYVVFRSNSSISLKAKYIVPNEKIVDEYSKNKIILVDIGWSSLNYKREDIENTLSHYYKDVKKIEARIFPYGKIILYTGTLK